jgi:outer membrane protein OmpA-like peptidoglycan-associated protein
MEKTMRTLSNILVSVMSGLAVVLTVGCSSLKTSATADVAVTNVAVESAVGADGSQFAPIEMNAARSNLAQGMVITLSDVLFGTNLARLNADGMRSTQKLVTLLQENPQRTVLIEGFTDSTGSAKHNLDLSERRANAVSSVLVEMGVAQERIDIHGYGEEFPVAANNSAANRQLNRRVEIVLSDDQGTITPR